MQIAANNDVKGIDVSRHQGTIDWKKVVADGVKYAIIKSSEGITWIDTNLAKNAAGAKAAGIPTTFYHYARPEKNGAEAEAKHFVNSVKGLKIDFPLVLDVEGEASSIGKTKLIAWCETFCSTVSKLSGKDVMIYTGASFAGTFLGSPLGKYPLWVAHYGLAAGKAPMSNPTWSKWSLFQYSESGKVSGISGNVDMNWMNKAFYDKYTNSTPVTSPSTPTTVTKETSNMEINVFVNGVKLEKAGLLTAEGRSYPGAEALRKMGINVRFDNETKTLYLTNA